MELYFDDRYAAHNASISSSPGLSVGASAIEGLQARHALRPDAPPLHRDPSHVCSRPLHAPPPLISGVGSRPAGGVVVKREQSVTPPAADARPVSPPPPLTSLLPAKTEPSESEEEDEQEEEEEEEEEEERSPSPPTTACHDECHRSTNAM